MNVNIDPLAQDIVAVGLTLAFTVLILQGRRIGLRLGRIDAQVNNVPEGTPTLRQNVDTLIVDLKDVHARLDTFGGVRQNVDTLVSDLKNVHARLDTFIAADVITTELHAINARLNEMAAAAARHHPDG